MTEPTYFYLIFGLTVLATRGILYYFPMASPTIAGFRFHHWMYGLALIGLGVRISNLFLFAMGLGLFIDEVTFILIGGKTHEANFSAVSLIGTACLSFLVFAWRMQIFVLFEHISQ